MVFSNLFFIYAFLPLCLIAYYAFSSLKARNTVLLTASLTFYAMGEPVYVFLLIAAALSAYLFAFGINANRGKTTGKILLAVSAAINVSFLFVFKYAPLLINTPLALFGAGAAVPSFALPIGISFYTFQILTYTADIYANKIHVQRSFADFLLYVSLFPQLIAGPIVRYADIETQLGKREASAGGFASGAVLFVCGLCKKVLLADRAGAAAAILLKTPQGALAAWFGIIMYAFQIYFDFAGYSDMAVGLGRMFGFEFKMNFNYPYISKSVTEFWRRWHISLGTFFRDYVYIPLGGGRKRRVRNILTVWLLTGLWHGASWNFALWGLYYAALLLMERYIFSKIKFPAPGVVKTAVKTTLTFTAVLIGWVLFYYTDTNAIIQAFTAMFSFKKTDAAALSVITGYILLLPVCVCASTPLAAALYRKIRAAVSGIKTRAALDTAFKSLYAAAGLLICTTRLVGTSFSPFLYYKF